MFRPPVLITDAVVGCSEHVAKSRNLLNGESLSNTSNLITRSRSGLSEGAHTPDRVGVEESAHGCVGFRRHRRIQTGAAGQDAPEIPHRAGRQGGDAARQGKRLRTARFRG